ncbi:hypothetical protein BH23ACT9_BH23ACT9_10980 [soil metagenome]
MIGEGVLMMAGAIVNPDCVVGDHSTIDTGASLDHDSVIGRCVSLAPNVATGGGVHIGDHKAISIGAVVAHGRSVGTHTVTGARSVVVMCSDLPPLDADGGSRDLRGSCRPRVGSSLT